MISITGATGHLGKATVDALLARGVAANEITVLVRDESKAADLKTKGVSIRIGNYDDLTSLVNAFQGVTKLLLISGSDINNRLQHHKNAIDAAKKAGVKQAVYTSFVRKNETASSPIAMVADSHIETEKYLKASGLNYVIMKNTLYAEMLPVFFGEQVLTNGIFLPGGQGRGSFATRTDMGEAAAVILSSEGHDNKEYLIAGNENVSFSDMAQQLSQISGKPVAYLNPTKQAYIEVLSNAGVPAEYVGMFAGFAEAIAQGEFETQAGDLERLIGRKPTSLHDLFKATYSPKN